jgi:hypothetical protein
VVGRDQDAKVHQIGILSEVDGSVLVVGNATD